MTDVNSEILNYLKSERNFEYEAYHSAMLERRIQNRINNTTAKSTEEYLGLIKNNPEELDRLIDNFMINVSHFFRDPLCFELLGKSILPGIVEAKLKTTCKTIRIWSAGCANGEEAYSVAILLKEYFEHQKIELNVDFFATDFDVHAIRNAENGTYKMDSLREVKFGLIEKYFTKDESGYTVMPALKKMIQFSVYDLLDKRSYAPTESIFGDFDLVLCRNVLIYFNQEFQEVVFNKIYRSMTSDGILILGESEAPISHFKGKFIPKSKLCKIYEKAKTHAKSLSACN